MSAAPDHSDCPCSSTNRGWHVRKGPLPLLQERHELPSWGTPGWVDHAYRLRLPDGRWQYVAEPYGLHEEALADLMFLAENGYDVTITAWEARHYPGHTVAVRLEEVGDDGG